MYVITVETAGKTSFYAIDRDSGYPYWTTFLSSAKMFPTFAEAKNAITDKSMFVDPWFHGAPLMIHSGLDLSNSNPRGVGEFSIKKIVFETIETETVTGPSGLVNSF